MRRGAWPQFAAAVTFKVRPRHLPTRSGTPAADRKVPFLTPSPPCPVCGVYGPPRQWSMRWWSGVKPLAMPHSTAWVRLPASILR